MFKSQTRNFRQYTPSDLLNMDFSDTEEYNNLLSANPKYFSDLFRMSDGEMYTFTEGENVIYIAGFCKSLMNYRDVYLFSSNLMKHRFNLEALKSLKELMAYARVDKNRHGLKARLQTGCKNIQKNKRFLEFLGFKQECLMKQYGFNGEDMFLYSITEED